MKRSLLFALTGLVALELELNLTTDATADQKTIGAVAVLAVVALAWSPRRPVACLLLWASVLLADSALGGTLVATGIVPLLAFVVAAFMVGRETRGWPSLIVASAAPVLLTAANQLVPGNDYSTVNDFAFFAVMFAAPVLVGRVVADRKRIAAALEEEAEAAQLARDRASEAAALEERVRLSNTLRDAIADRIAEVAIQAAGAERILVSEPDRAVPALAAIELRARAVLTDIREVLGVLRRADGSIGQQLSAPRADAIGSAQMPSQWTRWIKAPAIHVAVAIGLSAAIAVEISQSSELLVGLPVAMALCALLVAPIAMLGCWPVPAASATFGLLCLIGVIAAPVSDMVTPLAVVMLAPFAVAVSHNLRLALLGLAVCIFGSIFLMFFVNSGTGADDNLVATLSVIAVSWAVGRSIRRRDLAVAQLQGSVDRLEDERESRERLATVTERARVAREVHDVVGHAMTAVILQAEAAQRLWETDPVRAQRAINLIGTVARQVLTHVCETLTASDSPLDPQTRSLDNLDALLEYARGSQLQVDLAVIGRRRELPATVELTAYRLIQEALTNAARHAGPTSVDVLVEYGEQDLRLAVVDAGPSPRRPRAQVRGSGHGLLGMRERVEACGGWVTAEHERRGFAVRTSLPLSELAS